MEHLPWIIPLVLVVIVGLWAMSTYNGLVSRRNEAKNSWSQIDVQLKRRYDLIPNLVETAKGYMKHERETLEAVVAARQVASGAVSAAAAAPGDPAAMAALQSAEAGMGAALGRLFAVSEAYPDLKANQNMLQLQEELTNTENQVGFARQAFNNAVTAYNTARETFPSVVIAGSMGFQEATLFEIERPEQREVPKVSF